MESGDDEQRVAESGGARLLESEQQAGEIFKKQHKYIPEVLDPEGHVSLGLEIVVYRIQTPSCQRRLGESHRNVGEHVKHFGEMGDVPQVAERRAVCRQQTPRPKGPIRVEESDHEKRHTAVFSFINVCTVDIHDIPICVHVCEESDTCLSLCRRRRRKETEGEERRK